MSSEWVSVKVRQVRGALSPLESNLDPGTEAEAEAAVRGETRKEPKIEIAHAKRQASEQATDPIFGRFCESEHRCGGSVISIHTPKPAIRIY